MYIYQYAYLHIDIKRGSCGKQVNINILFRTTIADVLLKACVCGTVYLKMVLLKIKILIPHFEKVLLNLENLNKMYLIECQIAAGVGKCHVLGPARILKMRHQVRALDLTQERI